MDVFRKELRDILVSAKDSVDREPVKSINKNFDPDIIPLPKKSIAPFWLDQRFLLAIGFVIAISPISLLWLISVFGWAFLVYKSYKFNVKN